MYKYRGIRREGRRGGQRGNKHCITPCTRLTAFIGCCGCRLGSSRVLSKNWNLIITLDSRVALELSLTFPSHRLPRRSPLSAEYGNDIVALESSMALKFLFTLCLSPLSVRCGDVISTLQSSIAVECPLTFPCHCLLHR